MNAKSFTVFVVLFCFSWAASAQVCVDLPNGRSRLDGVWSPNSCEYNLSGREQTVGTGRTTGATTESVSQISVAELKSADGRPILAIQQVSVSLLNWVPSYGAFGGYGDQRIATYPGSTSPMMQSALVRLTPRAALEITGMKLQGFFNIAGDNRVQDNFDMNRYGYGFFTPPGAVLNIAVPTSTNPDVWYGVETVKPDQIRDGVRYGISRKQAVAAGIFQLGGLYVLLKANNAEWTTAGIGLMALGNGIEAQRVLQHATGMRFVVRLQVRNAQTGFIETLEGRTGHIFNILNTSYKFFYESFSGGTTWTSWDDAIGEALAQIAAQAAVRLPSISRQLRNSALVAEVMAKGGELSEDEAALRESAEKLEGLKKAAEITRLKLELDRQRQQQLEEIRKLEEEAEKLRQKKQQPTTPPPTPDKP